MKTDLQKICLVRHGQTDANAQGIVQGEGMDPYLSLEGQEQARQLAHAIHAELPADEMPIICTSPKWRAQETAKIIQRAFVMFAPDTSGGLSIQKPQMLILKDLREVDLGVWGGLTYQEVAERYPEELRHRQERPMNFCYPNGEEHANAQERAWQAFSKTIARHPNNHLIFVAHSEINRLILAKILNTASIFSFRQRNACLNVIERERDRLVIVTLCGISHLT